MIYCYLSSAEHVILIMPVVESEHRALLFATVYDNEN
jgi:hypothetical protein